MTLPGVRDVHVDAALTDLAIGFIQSDMNYVARRMFPVVNVGKRSDSFFEFDRGDMFRNEAQKRAPGTTTTRGGFRLSTQTYECEEFAYEHEVPIEVAANADLADMDMAAVMHVAQKILIAEEKEFIDNFFVAGAWANESSPATWTTAGGGDPIGDIRGAIAGVQGRIGIEPNRLLFGRDAWDIFIDHPDTLDRIKHTQTGVVTKDLVAAMFGIQECWVANAVEDTAAEGAAESVSRIAADHVLVLYATPTPSIMTPSAGYTFAWDRFDRGNAEPALAVSTYFEDDKKQTVYHGSTYFDMRQTFDDSGEMLLTVTTS